MTESPNSAARGHIGEIPDLWDPEVHADRRELAWWRGEFSCRFMAGNLPKPGDQLMGIRFQLMVATPEGLRRYER